MISTIKSYLQEHEEEMFDLLERIVNINSHTANTDGVNAVSAVLETELRTMGFDTRYQRREDTGHNLIATSPGRTEGGVLMVGHMDTVFPPEMGFDTYSRQGDTVYGPGVSDMKGGLVIGIYAAKALQAAGLLKEIPVAFVFNSDEEIGSPNSRDIIVEEAKKADFCFVMEGSGQGGEVVTGRKGRIVFDLIVEGEAGHAGHAAFPKPSAIVEIARMIGQLEALNDPEQGTSLNVGQIEGGVGPNTVAAKATARIETRFTSAVNRDAVWAAINGIAASTELDGTSARVEVEIERPPMEVTDTNMALFAQVEEAGREIGLEVQSVFRGGGSDANVIAEAGVPVLDGMGPSGAKIHTRDEYMLTDCMVRQALLTAVSITKAAWTEA